MVNVFFATRLRGFFKHLINSKRIDANISFKANGIYETNNLIRELKNKIGRCRLFDELGIIQIINVREKNYDLIGSYNRFLHTTTPYFIYVENPTALYHYQLRRGRSYLGKKKIQKELLNPNLKCIIFMSKACSDTFEKLCGKISESCSSQVIYPLLPLNDLVTKKHIEAKCSEKELNILYISQGLRFLSKGGLEVLSAFENLKKQGLEIKLKIVTSIEDVDSQIIKRINSIKGVTLNDFKFSFREMQELYAASHILLQPTSDDSFSLTILEAIKSGLPVIASNLYSIPEVVTNGWNGYLCPPHHYFFDTENLPNPDVWNHRSQTIYSGKVSYSVIEFLERKISQLYFNRSLLTQMSLNSYQRADSAPFSENYISNQWNTILKAICN